MFVTREFFRSSLFCLLACAVILLFASIVIGRAQDLRAVNLQVRTWRDIEMSTERMLVALGDSETRQRGYLLTQDPSYLEPYAKSSAEVSRFTNSLEMLTASTPAQLEQAKKLAALAMLKLEQLSAGISLNQMGDTAAALATVKADRGKALLDQIRADADELRDTASQRAQASRAMADLATQSLVSSVVITSALSIVLLILLTYFLRRDGRRIRESAEQLSITLLSIGDAVVTTDGAGRVTFLNPAAANIARVQLSTVPVPFEDLFVLVDEFTGAASENPITRVLRDGKTIELGHHMALRRPDGALVSIEDSASPLRDEKGKVRGVVFVFKDVSERRRTERELASIRSQLEASVAELSASELQLRQADRNKDEFLATLAHELRNPVAPIRHAIKLLDNEGIGEEQRRWAREVIKRQSGHMARLLDDLLDSARITRGELLLQPAVVDFKLILTAALDIATPLIEKKGHTLTISVPERPINLRVDGVRMAQVLSNLLTNAAKYTEPHGRIELKVESREGQFWILVTDSGAGLSAETIPKLFKMFSQVQATLDRSEGGLGIGLSLASALIELHGGRIEVSSEGMGRGSTFAIVLPASVLDAGAAPVEQTVVPERSSSARQVLIIDDNVDAAASLGMLMEMCGHDVLIAHSGEDGIKVARQCKPEAIVVDIGLPGMNGYEVAATLRREPWCADARLIALTGWGQPDDKRRALAAGFDHHLTKPADPDELERLIADPI